MLGLGVANFHSADVDIKGKKDSASLLLSLVSAYLLQHQLFVFVTLKGSKMLNGGPDSQDTNQLQHNGDSTEEKRDKHEVSTKKK